MPALALLLTLTAALLWAPKAQACSCASAPRVLAPVEVELGGYGAPSVTKAVPTNGKLWFSDRIERDEGRARIVDSHDEVIDGRWSTIDAAGTPWRRLHIFHPAAALSPRDEVRYQLPGPDDGWQTRVRIPVGDGPDHTPPSVPQLGDVTWANLPIISGGSCEAFGHPEGRDDAVSYAFALGDVPQPALLLLQQDGDLQLDPTAIDGQVTLSGDYASAGAAHACSTGGWAWTLAEGGHRLRWGAYDLAGNFSGWSAWEVVDGPIAASDGDDAPDAAPLSSGCGGGSFSAVLGLGLFLRRRRQTSAR